MNTTNGGIDLRVSYISHEGIPMMEFTPERIKILATKVDYATVNLIEMFLQGKTLEQNKQEYLNVILSLPWVANDQIKAVAKFSKLAMFFNLINKLELQDDYQKGLGL